MNLLILINSLDSGGAERVATNLANYWASKGWWVRVLTLTPKSLDFYELHPAVERIVLDVPRESTNLFAAIIHNLHRIWAVRQALIQSRPDVALAMMSSANVLLALAAIGVRGLVTVGSERIHPPQLPIGAIWDALRGRYYRRLSAMVSLTQESAAWLYKHAWSRNLVIIPNPVTWPIPEHIPMLSPPLKTAEQRRLIAVGRLCEQKGFDLLVTVFHRLAVNFPEWQLVVLGEGPDREALEIKVQSIGLMDRIQFPGRVGNLGPWYESADLYVMSSRFEGFPNTLVEAMAHGCPAVSFDCDTGPRDIIRHEVDGLLVAAGDAAALEKALNLMMSNEGLRKYYAERAVEVRDRFSLERIAGMWERLFEALKQE